MSRSFFFWGLLDRVFVGYLTSVCRQRSRATRDTALSAGITSKPGQKARGGGRNQIGLVWYALETLAQKETTRNVGKRSLP